MWHHVVADLETFDFEPDLGDDPRRLWPMTMGVWRGRSPEMAARSEWHSPTALIWSKTSPFGGGSNSTSSIPSGRLSA